MANSDETRTLDNIRGIDIEVVRRGTGKPVLVLLSEEAHLELGAPFVAQLAASHDVVMPMPPGFGRSARPDWIASPDDISYIYLDLMDKLGLGPVPVVAFSLGGWIALEMAVKNDAFASRLALVGSFGVKIGGPYDRDIQDIWTLNAKKVAELKWHDPQHRQRDFTVMPEDELTIIARNTESFARFCWDPYMHNPKLRLRLHRVTRPTMVLWGENDGLATTDYGRGLAGMIPGATFKTIAAAGHYPQIEQPDVLLREIETFIG
jgi:pimeloyl-ACP methyl ester carboxylesterase